MREKIDGKRGSRGPGTIRIRLPSNALPRLAWPCAALRRNWAGKARVILMFVPGPADTEKVVLGEGGIASGAPEGTVVVNMSTVDRA